MTIVENNALLDEFMESKGEEILHKDQWGGVVWGSYKPHSYHSDWNLLMGVVEKLEQKKYVIEITGNRTYIDHGDEHFRSITALSENNKKESVYNALVSFVKYNKGIE